MAKKPFSKFTLVLCFLIHIQLLAGSWWVVNVFVKQWLIVESLLHGVLYLSYPVCGWIAEVCFSNFKMIRASFIIIFISSLFLLPISIIRLYFPASAFDILPWVYVGYGAPAILCCVGVAMFEANAIQFGMNQMLEASSEQLSSFIHWYFWCMHVGPIFMHFIVVGVYWYFSHYAYSMDNIFNYIVHVFGWYNLFCSIIQLFVSSVGLLIACFFPKYFYFRQTSDNPLKLMFQVLKYSYDHKYPERRSAFTYWENDIPSRINLGKEKYGGPFTYEQVEDVKAVLRLLLLIVSLLGFHLSGDGYSLTNYIMYTMGCPHIWSMAEFVTNPSLIFAIVVLIGVPVFQLLQKIVDLNRFSMLQRIWSGLFLCLVTEALHCVYSLLMNKKEFECPEFYNHVIHKQKEALLLECLMANYKINVNSSCEYFCTSPPVSSVVIDVAVIILLVQGIAYLLVFMTVLEFICAQSPNAMKGLMIGVWYSTLAIKECLTNILDIKVFLDPIPWNLYHGAKGGLVFISIVLFLLVCKTYRYRERNEVVNEQTIIEEQYERELLLNKSQESLLEEFAPGKF